MKNGLDRRRRARPLTRISFGSTAAMVTSMGLIVGLDAASAPTRAIVSSLMIVAVADNLSDSLSIHLYQESEQVEPVPAFWTTLANFGARLATALTFVGIALALPQGVRGPVAVAWGLALLAVLTSLLSRARGVRVTGEVAKHLGVALVVLVVSRTLVNVISNLMQ
jgi:VIT1/CCC1 family predicted Fe2+/Mn2+ transporter